MMPTTFNFFDLNDFVSQRPELSKRKFVSKSVENTIKKVKNLLQIQNWPGFLKIAFPIL